MIHEHHLQVPRTARYFTLGSGDADEVWVVLHGYGQLAERFLERFAPLERADRLLLAPEGLSRFYLDGIGRHGPEARVGATWMTREDRLAEIEDYVGYLDRLYEAVAERMARRPRRLVALGFSQGAATAARWALLGRAPVDRLVLWAGTLPPEVDLAAQRTKLSRLHLVLVVGDQDEYAEPGRVAEAEASLDRAGVPHRVLRYRGGHRIEEEALRQLAAAGD